VDDSALAGFARRDSGRDPRSLEARGCLRPADVFAAADGGGRLGRGPRFGLDVLEFTGT